MAEINFNSNEVPDAPPMGHLPAGTYTVAITQSEVKATKAGTGSYLELRMQVLDEGDCKGRLLFDRLNLDNPNRTAVEIAKQTLKKICVAVGVPVVTDSSQLHDKPMLAKVAVRPRQDLEGEFSNDVKDYKAVGATPPEAAPGGDEKAPW